MIYFIYYVLKFQVVTIIKFDKYQIVKTVNI